MPTLTARRPSLALLVVGLGLAVHSCKGSPGPTVDAGLAPATDAGGDRAAPLAALGRCTLDVYRAFLASADRLKMAAALPDGGTPEAWTAARQAWLAAMALWQEADVFQYGPAGSAATSPGGRSLRDEIYPWPFFDRCLIEQQLVSERYRSPDFATSLITGRGLGALEYLLFHEGGDNACPADHAINTGGGWQALSADALKKRKAAYAAVVAAEVARHGRRLVDAWAPEGGNFLGEILTAGSGSKVFSTRQAAANAMSDALFYIERPLKDRKLAGPMGLKECAAPPCLDLLESRFARQSKTHLIRNLNGFEKLLWGCGDPPLGFDDMLLAAGAPDLPGRLKEKLDLARQALDAIPGDDLENALRTDPPSVRRVYDAINGLVVLMKTEFTGVLNLTIPAEVAQDNDA